MAAQKAAKRDVTYNCNSIKIPSLMRKGPISSTALSIYAKRHNFRIKMALAAARRSNVSMISLALVKLITAALSAVVIMELFIGLYPWVVGPKKTTFYGHVIFSLSGSPTSRSKQNIVCEVSTHAELL